MKKIFALLALVLGVVSCQTEPEGLDVNVGGEQEVMLTVSLPETTRANSANGFDLNSLATTDYSLRYILEVYLGDNCQRHVLVSDNTSVAFPVRLAPDRNYQLVVWADIVKGNSENDRYYNTTNGLDEVTIIESNEIKWNAMNETRDAFTATKAVSAQDIATGAITMTLKRPFAKLRVVATDYDDVADLGLKPAKATVVYSQDMPRIYNALTGVASNAALKSHTINYPATTADAVYSYENGEYTLFADYFFVPETGTAKFQFNVYADAEGTNLIKATNFNTDIYVAANKLTTIKGDVLTTGANIKVDVEENGKFDEEETYTYVNSGADLIKAINSNGKSVLGNHITVNEGDIAIAGSLAATRSTDSKSVINLNGFTVTVNNKNENGDALITLANNHTLVFAGEGNIVMTSESTAPFVNTDTNDAIVIIEQATVTNQSTNLGAAVVDGDAIVNAAANVDENAVSGEVQPQLEYVLANGGEVTLFEDATSDKILAISTTNPVVIDLGGKTFTFTSNRGFRFNENANIVIKNGTIVNNVSGGRCVETRAGGINLTLENVTLTATNGASQPFTVGGSGNNVNVNINNSTLTSGNGGYGITTFNPVALNINNSTVSGYAALNIKEASSSLGSAGSVINVVGSILNGVNNVTANESNSFSTIMIEDNNIKINVDSTSIVKATTSNGNGQCIVGFGNELVTSKISGCELTFAGEIVLEGEQTSYVGYSTNQGSLGNNTVKFAAKYADALKEEGWIVDEPTDGLVTVYSAIAQVGDNVYKTLAEAVAAAKTGETITLLEPVVIESGKTVVLDLNGKTITGNWHKNVGAIITNNGTLTIEGGTISSTGKNGGSAILNKGTLTVNGATLNGAPNANGSWPSYTVNNTGTMEAENTTITSYHGAIASYGDDAEATLNNCVIDMAGIAGFTSHGIYTYNNGKVIVNGGTYENKATDQSATGASVINGAVEVNAGTFSGRIENYSGTPVLKGGTFTVDPSKFVNDDYEVVKNEENGEFTIVRKADVAKIGDVGYTSLIKAVAAAQNGDTIVFNNDIEQANGVIITDKNITIDLGGNTFTVTEGANTNNRNFKVNGSSVVTIKNGTMVAAGEYSSGAYGTLRTEGNAKVTLDNVKLYNYRGNGFNVKVCTGTTVTINNNSEIYSQYGGGVEAAGGIVELNDVKIEQNGVYNVNAWNSVAIGLNSNGKVTVNSGNYSASAISTDANAAQGTWVAYVMSSGGTLDIKGGTFNGVVAETAAAANACGLICADRAAVVEIHGGTFNSNGAILDMRNNAGTLPNPKATLYGGTFSADPRKSGLYSSNLITVAEGHEVVEEDGKFKVK